MPIIQGAPNPAASIFGGLAGLATQFITANMAHKQAEARRQDALKQQAQANALAQARLQIDAQNAGDTYDPKTNKVAPWTPPVGAAPNVPGNAPPPGADQPPPAKPVAPQALTPGIAGGANPLAKPHGVSLTKGAPAPAAQPVQIDPELQQQAALAKSMQGKQMEIYASETQQAQTLTAQGAPAVLIKRHTDAAHQALIDAGTWAGHYQSAEDKIFTEQHRNDPAKPTYADLHGNYAQGHPQPPKPTWADLYGSYGERHPKPKSDPSAPSSLEDTIYAQASAPGLSQQQSLKIIDNPRNGLNYKQRSAMRQAIKDQKPDKPPADKENPDNESNASRIMQTSAVGHLPQADQADLNTNLRRYGYGAVVQHLQDLASGKAKDPSTPPDRAKRVLQAIQ